MSSRLSREEAYIEIMLLMALSDGQLHEEEATQLALTVANRPEFQDMSQAEISQTITAALERIQRQSVSERLTELSRCLKSESAKFKATVFAYGILVADGIVASGETACLRQIEKAFGLAAPPRPKGRPPLQKRAEETRRRLLEAGKRLFLTQGYHATSSKKIAREAGVAIGSFYNYFDDKKALLLEIFQKHAMEQHDEVLHAAGHLQSVEKPEELIRGIVELMKRLQPDSIDFGRERALLRYADDDVRRLEEMETQRVVRLVLAVLESHREWLRVEDLEGAAHLVVKTVEEVIHTTRLFKPELGDERLEELLVDMVRRFLFP
jgi:AcrR family transcriptional regulator